MTMVNEPPDNPIPTRREVEGERRRAHGHERHARGVDRAAHSQNPRRAVAVGDGAGEGLPDAPDEVLDGDGEGEDLGRPVTALADRGGEEPEARPQTVGDQGYQTPAQYDERRRPPPP